MNGGESCLADLHDSSFLAVTRHIEADPSLTLRGEQNCVEDGESEHRLVHFDELLRRDLVKLGLPLARHAWQDLPVPVQDTESGDSVHSLWDRDFGDEERRLHRDEGHLEPSGRAREEATSDERAQHRGGG